MTDQMHIRCTIYEIAGENVDTGLDALCDALLLLTTNDVLLHALQIAYRLADHSLYDQAQHRELEQQAAKLRAQLTLLEQQLDQAA